MMCCAVLALLRCFRCDVLVVVRCVQENAPRAKQGKRLELLAWTAAWDRREFL